MVLNNRKGQGKNCDFLVFIMFSFCYFKNSMVFWFFLFRYGISLFFIPLPYSFGRKNNRCGNNVCR